MLSVERYVDLVALERATGWAIKPEGACKDDRCVPLDEGVKRDDLIDLQAFAAQMQAALIHDEEAGLWCLGPEAGGRALSSAQTPDLVLPDVTGGLFQLRSLLGRKVLLVAWASW